VQVVELFMSLLPFLRKSPFARLLFFYASGIAIADNFGGRGFSILQLVIILALLWLTLLVIVVCYRNYNTGWLSGGLAALILFLCGMLAAKAQLQHEVSVNYLPECTGIYTIRIIDLPETADHTVKATARVLTAKTGSCPTTLHMRILVFLNRDSAADVIQPGSELLIRSALKRIPGHANPGEFDYGRYLAARHIYRQAFLKKGSWILCGSAPLKSPLAMACLMRQHLLRSFEKIGMSPSDNGLLAALTLGYKEDLDTRTRQVFSRAGVMHIMALSGFNVAIIAVVLGFLLGILDFNRAGKIGTTTFIILFLWLFAFVTGLSPSVIRATLMISLVMTGRLFHRQINTYNILFASAFLLLAFSPGMLADVSFQLSFAAVAGIVLYQPILYNMIIFRNTAVKKIWQLFTLSCAAQLATFPITLYYFHQFPVYFWLTNLYVTPLVSLIICIAGIYLSFAFIKPLAFLLGKILMILLHGLFLSVAVIEELPFSLIHDIYLSSIEAVIIILMILVLGMFILFRKLQWLQCFLVMMIVFMSLYGMNSLKLRNQEIWLIGSIRGETAINLIDGRSAILLLGSGKQPDENRLSYAFGNFWISHGISPIICGLDTAAFFINKNQFAQHLYYRSDWRGKNGLISFGGKRMIILRDDRFYQYRSLQPLSADMLVITGNMSVRPNRIAEEIESGLIILDSSVKNYQANQWKKACKKMGLKYYSISDQGAYCVETQR
jgi:competence protein ComEC